MNLIISDLFRRTYETFAALLLIAAGRRVPTLHPGTTRLLPAIVAGVLLCVLTACGGGSATGRGGGSN